MTDAVAVAPGPVAMLDGPASAMLAPSKSVLVKQKLDLMQLIYKYCTGNKYRIVETPAGWGEGSDQTWDDDLYDKAKKQAKHPEKYGVEPVLLMTAKEDSSCFCKLCCRSFRELKMEMREGDFYAGKEEMRFRMFRPFKFPINCVFCELCSPEISVENLDGTLVGKAVHNYSCMENMCGKQSWRIEDSNQQTKYYIQDNTCICTGGLTNSCAPTWCCPLRTMKILDENKQEFEVAEEKDAPMMQNIFACNLMRLCLPGLDQYKMTFPPNATPEDKSLLLAGLFLIEFSMFENNEDGEDVDF